MACYVVYISHMHITFLSPLLHVSSNKRFASTWLITFKRKFKRRIFFTITSGKLWTQTEEKESKSERKVTNPSTTSWLLSLVLNVLRQQRSKKRKSYTLIHVHESMCVWVFFPSLYCVLRFLVSSEYWLTALKKTIIKPKRSRILLCLSSPPPLRSDIVSVCGMWSFYIAFDKNLSAGLLCFLFAAVGAGAAFDLIGIG